jgi:GalNAc-alpha-(1->4)-GalNAc-alpha-(1->3)-diNAcBac-PP-undecaprenol alpha-1,4-N-acetyl-D-galactosaminyltransferase
MRITLVISKMSNAGGTERMMSVLSSGLCEKGHEVTVITVSDCSDKSFYPLDPAIKLINSGILGLYKNPALKFIYLPFALAKLRKAIMETRPDIVIPFVDVLNILTIMSLKGKNISVIATEHFSPGIRKIGAVWDFLRPKYYRKAKCITVLTPEDKTYFPNDLQHKIHVTLNPAVKPNVSKNDYSLNNRIIGVGRLVKEKGFDLLISAFSELTSDFPELKLDIYGTGVEYDDLTSLIKESGLSEKVFIHSPVKNIIEKMTGADIFILPSRLEPFGMVIVEAMSAGVPVIATDCPNGPKNIITNKDDGILVKNGSVQEISDSIKLVLTDEELRKKLGGNAKKITEKLSVENFIKKWEELIQ